MFVNQELADIRSEAARQERHSCESSFKYLLWKHITDYDHPPVLKKDKFKVKNKHWLYFGCFIQESFKTKWMWFADYNIPVKRYGVEELIVILKEIAGYWYWKKEVNKHGNVKR